MNKHITVTLQLSDDTAAVAASDEGGVDVQVQRWLQLGRAVARSIGAECSDGFLQRGKAVEGLIAEVNQQAGRDRLAKYLESQPFPHYEQVSGTPDVYVRIDENGQRSVGRFVGRQFEFVVGQELEELSTTRPDLLLDSSP
ncbi:hypothetical protein [Calycomorphotria hydatis]|uniref:Uncharacterized protein n=1 Tax=Calycomorphotria hydatis TaxID=2528027 RepID=A0A517T848_9PLAN|nr:hypothetical protein [Calycomorphotria hydatis]QDT64555.1 hypothetical protein V22_17900 [Calycomorphotria hydatis]